MNKEPQNRINILIVEDQPICRLGIRMTLAKSDLGYELIGEATNVGEALNLLEQLGSQTDLILLDYMLPDGTGMDVIQAVKRKGLEAKIVVF